MATRGINGHSKGGRAERAVVQVIQPWWRRLEPSVDFCRTPLSGGWGKAQGSNVASHFNACGDLMCTSARFPFCIEVKWREQWSYDNFVDGKPTPPWGWWRQCVKAATLQGGGAVPMMWHKKNRRRSTRGEFPWIVTVPKSYADEARLSTPCIQWSEQTLKANGVDFAGVLPVAYFYTRFIDMSPKRMATKATT
jgi:hypothetical protein